MDNEKNKKGPQKRPKNGAEKSPEKKKQRNNRERNRRKRKGRHKEISKAMRGDLKKQISKSDLPDEMVEEQETVIEREEKQSKQATEEAFEENKKEVLEGGRDQEKRIKREKKEKDKDKIAQDEEFFDLDDLDLDDEVLMENAEVVDEKIDDNSNKNKSQKKNQKHNEQRKSEKVKPVNVENVKSDEAKPEVVRKPARPEKVEKPEKKKSYLDILQEEAKKFEKIEKQKAAGEKVDESEKPDVSDDWLDFLNGDYELQKPDEPVDGVLADATDRNRAQQDEGAEQESVEADIFSEQKESVDTPREVSEAQKNPLVFGSEGKVIDTPSAQKKVEGFHDGKRDELLKGEKGVDIGGGMGKESELFGGGKKEIESASEDVAGEESKVVGQPSEVISAVNSEKVLDDAIDQGRSQINQVLEDPTLNERSKKSGDDFMSELKSILKDVGFSFGAVKGFCSLGLIIIVLGGGFYFDLHTKIWDGVNRLAGLVSEGVGSGQEGEGELEVAAGWMVNSGEIAGVELLGSPPLPFTLESGLYFGSPVVFGELPRHMGVTTSLIVGETAPVAESDRFAYMVDVAGQLRNFYNTDLKEFLDNEQDRAGALDDFNQRLIDLRAIGGELFEEIQVRMEEVQAEFEVITDEKQAKEEEYFAYLKEFDGVNADKSLREFIDLRVKQEVLRTEYNALKNLGDDYEIILARVDARLDSIVLNRGALIQGVTVTPVTGDNLELIEVQ